MNIVKSALSNCRFKVLNSINSYPELLLSSSASNIILTKNFNSNRASISRINRLKYLLQYPTLLVNPDGSTFKIRYHEPKKIIKLPFDITGYSEQEKLKFMELRKPKTRVKIEEDIEVESFDTQKYLKYIKK